MQIRTLSGALGAAVALALAACSGESPAAPAAQAEAPPATPAGPVSPEFVDNFTLVDHTGATQELHKMTDASAIVLVMQGVGCPIVQQMTPDLKAIQAAYEPKGVKFMMLNSNIQDSPKMIAAEAEKFDIKMPILKDPDQSVGARLGAVRTAEVFVIDPKDWRLVFHGPLNDRLTYGRAKAVATENYTGEVLDAVLSGAEVPVIRQPADGCIINFVEHDPPSHG